MPFVVLSEIREALDEGRAVVALESTVISHGLPCPANLKLAQEMEEIVRAEGAVPATVGIIEGRVHVGLEAAHLERLARGRDRVRKVSRRDLPVAVGLGLDGATTVSATMYVAHQVGIELFATGGIGGVHRGHPFDVSADLTELGRTPVTVVCAGAKAILDLPLTREVLETQGVPVVGYGSDEMAAFYSRGSGLPADVRADTPQQAAQVIRARRGLGLQAGLLVTVPVPVEDEIPPGEIENIIIQATRQADEQGISGAALTPFLLGRLAELTEGRSVKTNVSLLHNNARVAARIAVALEDECQRTKDEGRDISSRSLRLREGIEREQKANRMINIALAQMDIEWAAPDANLDTARRMVAQAATEGADLVVLPELWGSAYDLAHAADHATSLQAGLFGEMAALAREHGLYIAGSLLEDGEGRVYNTCALYGPQGLVGSYRKLHLIGLMEEDRYLTPGDRLALCEGLPWGATGLAICYDLRFPEVFRACALAGARLVVMPAQWPSPRSAHWRTLLRARAIENQCVIVACNRVGADPNNTFSGASAVIGPGGEVLVEGAERPALLMARVDMGTVDKVRRFLPIFRDRRPECYRL